MFSRRDFSRMGKAGAMALFVLLIAVADYIADSYDDPCFETPIIKSTQGNVIHRHLLTEDGFAAAAWNGNIEALQAFLASNIVTEWLDYGLIHAAASGKEEAVRLLVEAGANPDAWGHCSDVGRVYRRSKDG